MFPFTRQV
jgi:uncharacterized protein